MSVGRWYPTVTQLPDGRVLTFAGDNIVNDRPGQPHAFEDASVDSLPSVYNPKTNQWTDLTGAKLTSPLYPYLFVLSDGRVFNAGPDTTTRILDPATWTWSTVGNEPVRRHERRHVPPEQDHEGRRVGGPGLQRREGVQRARSHRGDRHERRKPDLARDGADGVRPLVPQPDAAPGRHGPRERRPVELGRDRSRRSRSFPPRSGTPTRRRGRRSTRSRTGASTTRRRCCCPTAAC